MKTGEDVRISATAIIKRAELVEIGNHVAIDDYTVFTTALNIGDYVHIAPFVSCVGGAMGKLAMGNFTTVSAGSRIICRGDAFMGAGLVSNPIPSEFRDDVIGEIITMMDFSSIGTNVILMPNTWLAEGVVVGANSLVTKPIEEPWTIWVGSPARKIKERPSGAMRKFAAQMGYA